MLEILSNIGFPFTVSLSSRSCPKETSSSWFGAILGKKTAVDYFCEMTKGHVKVTEPYLQVAKNIRELTGVSIQNALIGTVIVGAFLLWKRYRKENPKLSTEELLKKLIDEQFGKFAEPILKVLEKLLAPMNGIFKQEVENEQPYLKGNKIFDDLIKAGVEEKKEKLLSQFSKLVAENKETLEKQAQAVNKPTQAQQATNNVAGMQEGALIDGLKTALEGLMEKAKEALIPVVTIPPYTTMPLDPEATKAFSPKP